MLLIEAKQFILSVLIATSLLSLSLCSDTQPSSSYTSVRALDKFGNSVQIQNARAAALRNGRLIVAASNGRDNIVVVSMGDRPVVHSLVLPILESDGKNHDHVLAMCCSGIKGDANWLLSQVQRYVTSVWDRYNVHELSSPALSHYISSQMSSFHNYKVENEFSSGISRDNDADWSRPLGIQSMLLSLHRDDPNILIIEPSGRVMLAGNKEKSSNGWHFGSIGKDSEKLMQQSDLISSQNDMNLSVSKVAEALIKVLLEDFPKNETEFMVEVLSRGGTIERKLVKYKNGREVSSTVVY